MKTWLMGVMAAAMFTAMTPSPVSAAQETGSGEREFAGFSHLVVLAAVAAPRVQPLIDGNSVDRLTTIIRNAGRYIYKSFRAFSFYWILIFGMFLGMAVAFGQAAEEEIRNYFMGVMVILGSHLLAMIMLYYFGTRPYALSRAGKSDGRGEAFNAETIDFSKDVKPLQIYNPADSEGGLPYENLEMADPYGK